MNQGYLMHAGHGRPNLPIWDNDEWQDLYLVNGWWLETSLYSNNFFRNRQGLGFDSKASEYGLDSVFKQHAFTYLDLDQDGDLDVITRSFDGAMQVFKNNLQQNNSVVFEFRDQHGNHFGIGNKVTIFYGENSEHHQIREIKSGGGFVSFDAQFAHFGLGKHQSINRFEIDWVDGSQTIIEKALPGNRKYIVYRE